MSIFIQTKGFSLTEVAVSLVIFALIGTLALRLGFYSTFPKGNTNLANQFHLQTGRVLESLKQDLRSALEVSIHDQSLEIIRLMEDTQGKVADESVVYRVSSDSILVERSGLPKQHDFSGLMKELKARLEVKFQGNLPNRSVEKASLLSVSISALGPDNKPIGDFSSALNLELRAGKISIGSETTK